MGGGRKGEGGGGGEREKERENEREREGGGSRGSALSTLPIVRIVKVVNHFEVYKVLGG